MYACVYVCIQVCICIHTNTYVCTQNCTLGELGALNLKENKNVNFSSRRFNNCFMVIFCLEC